MAGAIRSLTDRISARPFYVGRGMILAFACLGIFAAALAVRVYDLDQTPPGLYYDEAINGVDASKVIDSGDYRLWYPDNGGREGLFVNLQSLSVRAFGHEPWALRLVAAVAGAAIVAGIFLLAHLMFRGTLGTITGAAAATMAGFGYWHLALSRIGFRAILVGLVVVWGLVVLMAALGRYRRPVEVGRWTWRRHVWWLAAGAVFGLGLHTYHFWTAALIVLAVVVGSYRLIGNRREWIIAWGTFAAGAFVTAAPMLIEFLQHRDYLLRRDEIAVWKAPEPWAAAWDSIKKTALMFTGPGDCNPRQNFPCRAQLHPVTATLAGVGLVACVADLFRRASDGWRRLSSGLLLIGLVAMLLPAMLTFENLPHALRSLAAAPFAYLLGGVGAAALGQWLYSLRTGTAIRTTAIAGLIAAILWAAVDDTRLYFDEWPKRADVGPAFSLPLVEQARFLESRPGRHYLFFEPQPEWRQDGLSLGVAISQFLLWDEWRASRLVYVLKEDAPRLELDKPATVGVLSGEPGAWAGTVLTKLESRYPDGRAVAGPNGERYFVR